MLRLDLTSFDDGLHTLSLEPPPSDLDLDPERFRDIRVDVMLDIRGRRVLVTLDVAAEATLECDRTLVLFQQPIAGQHRMLFAPAAQLGRRDTEPDAEEEVHEIDAATRSIDLTEAVRDTLLLAVPARAVAPGAEAVELPSAFGAPAPDDESEIDPRWAALRALRDQDED